MGAEMAQHTRKSSILGLKMDFCDLTNGLGLGSHGSCISRIVTKSTQD